MQGYIDLSPCVNVAGVSPKCTASGHLPVHVRDRKYVPEFHKAGVLGRYPDARSKEVGEAWRLAEEGNC